MRFLATCTLTVIMGACAASPKMSDLPEAVSDGVRAECDAALALVMHGKLAHPNVWPLLWVDEDDPRPPLDCGPIFQAAGLEPYREQDSLAADGVVYTNLIVSRPVFASPTEAKLYLDTFVPPGFAARALYTLALQSEKWVVTGEDMQIIT